MVFFMLLKLSGRHGAISKKTGHQRIQTLLSSVSVRSAGLSLVGVSPFPVWRIGIPTGILRWRLGVRPLEPPSAPREWPRLAHGSSCAPAPRGSPARVLQRKAESGTA